MIEALPCRGCGAAIIALPDDPYLATLTGDPSYPYFLICPPSQNCFIDQTGTALQGGRLYYDCCGHVLFADYIAGTNLAALAATLDQQCQNTFAQECGQGGGSQNPLPPQSRPLYLNSERQGDAVCPDGTHFTFTVRAGLFTAKSQSAANLAAQKFADSQAQAHKVCMGSILPSELAFNAAVSASVTATGGSVAGSGNVWSITSGALPDGLSLSGDGPTVTISGTTTVLGPFTFTLKIVTPAGDSASKSFTLLVVAKSVIEAYWKMDEAGINVQRLDSINGTPLNPWTDGVAFASQPGLYGNCVYPVRTAPQLNTGCSYLANATDDFNYIAFYTLLSQTGSGVGLSLVFWIKLLSAEGVPNYGIRFCTANYIYLLFASRLSFSPTPPYLSLDYGYLDGSNVFVSKTWVLDGLISLPFDTWNFVHLFFDGDKVGISINNGPELTHDSGIPARATDRYDVEVSGCYPGSGTVNYLLLDEMAFNAQSRFTSVEVAYLYNGGAGRTWPIVLPP